MQRNDAVTAVTGEIFREGWSKGRGSMQGLGTKRSQMVRAAKGHRAAVFKAIKSGGCHTKAQLSNQLEYLTTKSSHIVDSRGVLDGKTQLNAQEIRSVTDRFSARWDEGFRPKMGHTTHMLMSFPVGTKGEDVRDVAAGVSAEEGTKVSYGIRPEHIAIDTAGSTHKVDMTESLGGISYAYLVAEKTGERIVVEERGDERSREGDVVGITFEDSRSYVFDASSEARIR